MYKYNIETLSFLIGSFRDIVQSFGQNNKSVEFYKRQVYGLANIGQIGTNEILFVEELVGMKNTNAVKWDKATEKIEQFIRAINETYSCINDTTKVLVLENLEKSGDISSSVKEKVYEVYGIDTKSIITKKKDSKQLNFGEIPSNKQATIKSNSSTDTYLKMLMQDGNNRIEVRNSTAVCCSDPSFYNCSVADILHTKRVLREMANGSEYKIGKEVLQGDSCHPIRVIKENKKLMDLASLIDWKTVYDENK